MPLPVAGTRIRRGFEPTLGRQDIGPVVAVDVTGANAVAVAARLLEENLTQRIAADLSELGEDRLRKNGSAGAAR